RLQVAALLLEHGNLAGAALLWQPLSRGTLSEKASLSTLGQLALAGDAQAQKLLEEALPQKTGPAQLFTAWSLSKLGDESARAVLLAAAAQPGDDQVLAAELLAELGEPGGCRLFLRVAPSSRAKNSDRELSLTGLADCGKEEDVAVLDGILS